MEVVGMRPGIVSHQKDQYGSTDEAMLPQAQLKWRRTGLDLHQNPFPPSLDGNSDARATAALVAEKFGCW